MISFFHIGFKFFELSCEGLRNLDQYVRKRACFLWGLRRMEGDNRVVSLAFQFYSSLHIKLPWCNFSFS
jgi:hypothetical protein